LTTHTHTTDRHSWTLWDSSLQSRPVSERLQTYALDRVANGTGARYIEGDEIKVDKMCWALTCLVKVKVKVTLVQGLRLCTSRTAHWGVEV
jgi:hypothetical protein